MSINMDINAYKNIVKMLEELMIECSHSKKTMKKAIPIYKTIICLGAKTHRMEFLPYNLQLSLGDCLYYKSLVHSNKKIAAIKELRGKIDLGLKEAKEIIEYIDEHF